MNVKTLIAAIALTLSAGAMAQTISQAPIVECINTSTRIVVDQPQALTDRLKPSANAPQATHRPESEEASEGSQASSTSPERTQATARAGYRIQVFDDNNPRTARRDAENMKAMIESRFSNLRAYVSFNSPYWRVKVGDFASRAEAESMAAEIKAAFPQLNNHTRVVRDRINSFE